MNTRGKREAAKVKTPAPNVHAGEVVGKTSADQVEDPELDSYGVDESGAFGRVHSRIRWTIERAGAEFDIDRRTLAKRLRQDGIEPGDDRKYSTAQIAAAVFGSLERERIRREAAEATLAEMKVAERRGELVQFTAVEQVWSGILLAVRQEILGANLPKDLEQRILENLRAVTARDLKPRGPST